MQSLLWDKIFKWFYQHLRWLLIQDHKAFHPSQLVSLISRDRIDLDQELQATGVTCVRNRLIFSTIVLSYWSTSGPGRLSGMRRTWSCLAVETLFLPIQQIVRGPPESMSFMPGTRNCCLGNPPLISRRTLWPICSRSKAQTRQRTMAQIFLHTSNPSMRKKNNSARSAAKRILIGPSSVDTSRYSRPDKMKCQLRRNKQIFKNRLPIRQPVRRMLPRLKRHTLRPRPKSLPRNPFRLLLHHLVQLQSLSSNMRPQLSRMWMRQLSSTEFYQRRCIFWSKSYWP